MTSIDSDQTLNCQLCRNDISPHEPKTIIGAEVYDFQRFFVFHPECWQYSLTNPDPASRRFFAKYLQRL